MVIKNCTQSGVLMNSLVELLEFFRAVVGVANLLTV
jgi:hypothetical protein